MIDTDKYEGHTPAPWNVKHGDMERYGETDTVVAKDDYHEYQVAEGVMRQDAQLIADAPLLLEEVKRLRENLKRIRHTVFYDIEENFTDEQAYDPVLIEIMEKMKAVL